MRLSLNRIMKRLRTQHSQVRLHPPQFAAGAATLLAFGLAVFLSPPCVADNRRYTYIYETTTMPKGMWEYEQWFTWSGYDDKDRFDFRHEIEYGVTDRFQLSVDVGTHDLIRNPIRSAHFTRSRRVTPAFPSSFSLISIVRNCWRPRFSRLITVPMGSCRIFATSA